MELLFLPKRRRANVMVDTVLAAARMACIDPTRFAHYSIGHCLATTLARYPFTARERNLVSLDVLEDFSFHGSEQLMVYTLCSLLKNALWAIWTAGKGRVFITARRTGSTPQILFTDTGPGIAPSVLPRVFDAGASGGDQRLPGIGLAFCQSVLTAFGGSIRCDTLQGQ